MQTMDIMKEHYAEYITHLFEKSTNIVKRDTSVCFYICSNYYFEIETEDDDYVDEVTGETVKGLRKYGASKEHRPNPIVEMGLFMDSDGIPLSMCITSGSDNEQTTAIPLEKKLTRMFKGKTFIYCADAGFDRFDQKNKGLYDDRAYKILQADNAFDLELYEEKVCKNGRTKIVKAKAMVNQKVIITFSRKMMEYQRHIRNRQIERTKKILVTLDPDTYKKGPHDVTRFIKRTSSTKSGEKITAQYELNQSIIEEEEN